MQGKVGSGPRSGCQNDSIFLLKELRFYPKDWHNFLRMSQSAYLTLLSTLIYLLSYISLSFILYYLHCFYTDSVKRHCNAASCNTSRETYSHFKIFGDREKLRGPEVFHFNVSTSTGKNCTRNLPCDLQSAEGILYNKVRVYNVKNMIIYCYGQSATLFY
jgi:hypothetical protein